MFETVSAPLVVVTVIAPLFVLIPSVTAKAAGGAATAVTDPTVTALMSL